MFGGSPPLSFFGFMPFHLFPLSHQSPCPLHHNVVPSSPVPRNCFPVPVGTKYPIVFLHIPKAIYIFRASPPLYYEVKSRVIARLGTQSPGMRRIVPTQGRRLILTVVLRQCIRWLLYLWHDRWGRVLSTVSWVFPGKSGHTLRW